MTERISETKGITDACVGITENMENACGNGPDDGRSTAAKAEKP